MNSPREGSKAKLEEEVCEEDGNAGVTGKRVQGEARGEERGGWGELMLLRACPCACARSREGSKAKLGGGGRCERPGGAGVNGTRGPSQEAEGDGGSVGVSVPARV
jgi:hypothetical protein